jgi:HD superfamily phosphodiesterase
MTDNNERRAGYIHLYGVAQFCVLIALKRGENVELATMAGTLHDIYSYANMDPKDHAHKSAILAREILESLQLTNDDETKTICDAVYTHSEKGIKHYGLNEVLIDADVLNYCLYNPTFEIMPQEKERYNKLKFEFGLAK